MSQKKIYVLDTSVYLSDFRSLYAYSRNDIVIPLTVLEEIDNNKKRQDGAGANARAFIRVLDQIREKGDLNSSGVRISKGKGLLFVKTLRDDTKLPFEFDRNHPDNQIIGVALQTKEDFPEKEIVLVSCDINMRLKCDGIGLKSENFQSNQVIKKRSELYSGFREIVVDDQVIDCFYAKKDVILDDVFPEKKPLVYPNEFLMLVSSSDHKKTALCRIEDIKKPLLRIQKHKTTYTGFEPKNKEQEFAMDLLMNPNLPLISLIGKAGSGKTLISLAAGLEQLLGKDARYNRLIVSRPVQPLGRDIGFLPGDLKEKMAPWLAPVLDNLRFLFGNDEGTLEEYMEKNIIEVEALTYIRGRSIQNAFIIIDEVQNLNRHEIKTILTRVGHNSKIILTGDIEQIDNTSLDETSNGLTYAIETFKDDEVSGHITLIKGERSLIATKAAQKL